jgi:precorrin-2 dehydrogenase/sirohydrochlorin ferrochelatase
MIPLFVDCTGRRIVIFGGGSVAGRKAAYFTGEADVLMVSRSFSEECQNLPLTRLELDTRDVSDEALSGIIGNTVLVVGALSDREENDRIGRICAGRHIFFNNADGNTGDVMLPSMVRGEQYTIAVSTGGSGPAVSRFLREYIEATLPDLDAMIGLQQTLRKALKGRAGSPEGRKAALSAMLHDPEIWQALKNDVKEAEQLALERYGHG